MYGRELVILPPKAAPKALASLPLRDSFPVGLLKIVGGLLYGLELSDGRCHPWRDGRWSVREQSTISRQFLKPFMLRHVLDANPHLGRLTR